MNETINWFIFFDDFFQEEKFDEADAELSGLDPTAMSPTAITLVLSATYCARDRLPSRKEFLEQGRDILIRELGPERAEALLKNRS